MSTATERDGLKERRDRPDAGRFRLPPLTTHCSLLIAHCSWCALLLASLVGVVAYLSPFFLPATAGDAGLAHAADAPVLFCLLVLCIAMALAAEVGGPGAAAGQASKLVALLGVLAALNGALRLLPTLAGASPIFLLILLVGYAYGPTYGFCLGGLSLLVSALITGGVGPWLPYQMLGAGWLGLTAGWLPDLRRHPRAERVMLAAFGGLWGLLYGAILNLWFWPVVGPAAAAGDPLVWQPGTGLGETLQRYAVFYLVTSLPYDLARSAATAALALALAGPLLGVLRRFQRRFSWRPIEDAAGDAAATAPAAAAGQGPTACL